MGILVDVFVMLGVYITIILVFEEIKCLRLLGHLYFILNETK